MTPTPFAIIRPAFQRRAAAREDPEKHAERHLDHEAGRDQRDAAGLDGDVATAARSKPAASAV